MNIPNNISDCIKVLNETVSDKENKEIVKLSEDEFIVSAHFGLGLWIRNNWLYGLDSSELKQSISGERIIHEDDLSSEILKMFYRSLKA